MTLSLSEVRAIRFPIARRGTDGYRAGEVDDFVDKVDITFTSILEENDRLKAQFEALKNDSATVAGGDSPADEELRAEVERLKAELEAARQDVPAAPAGDDSELRAEVERLRQRERQLTAELQQARQQPAPVTSTTTGNVERVEVTTSEQASPVVIRLVQLASEQAENLIAEAEAEAVRKRQEADRDADETTASARAEAERIETAAREEAERLAREAQAHAQQVNIDADNRRAELFSTLERERDDFQGKVDRLRGFESTYRSTLIEHLRKQADAVESDQLEPQDVPSLLADERGKSATPRLDALLADKG